MDLRSLVTPVESVLRATRPKVLQAYRREADPARFKDDGSAITDLDHELERDISAALLQLDDTWGVYGEESGTIRAGTPAAIMPSGTCTPSATTDPAAITAPRPITLPLSSFAPMPISVPSPTVQPWSRAQ